MKTRSKMTPFFAALALGAMMLTGSVLPSQAQTTTPQATTPQATIQTTLQPSAVTPGGWYWPMMWWPTNANTSGSVTVAPPVTVSQPTAFWGWWW